MIVVTGASGHLGRLVIDQLATSTPAADIVAGVRNPASVEDLAERGVQVRTLDYDRPDTVRDALAGADRVLLVSSSEIGQRAQQHQTVIDAATREGVSLLAYTTILHADTSTLALAAEHQATEAAIVASGLPSVLLRNGWYIENYTENLAPALEHGTFVGSAGDGRIAAATRSDYAAAAAAVLTGTTVPGTVYELAGPRFTMTEFAAEVSRQLGRTIGYTDVASADHHAILVQAGLPTPYADLLVDADLGIARGQLDGTADTLTALIGRPPTSLREAVAHAVGAFTT